MKTTVTCFCGENVPCQQELLHQEQQRETLPFKWGATELWRFFEEMCSAQTRAAASPVFLTAETLLTPDGWSNTNHLSWNPHGCSSLYTSLHRWICRPCYRNNPSSQYLPKARSTARFHSLCTKMCLLAFHHLHSVFTTPCQGFSKDTNQHVPNPAIHFLHSVLEREVVSQITSEKEPSTL